MSKILKVRNVNDYDRYLGSADLHSLVSVINYAEVSPIRHSLNSYSVYALSQTDIHEKIHRDARQPYLLPAAILLAVLFAGLFYCRQ